MSDIHPDIAKVFERNDGNRITQDVALGMAIAIQVIVNKVVADTKAEASAPAAPPAAPNMPPVMTQPQSPGVQDVASRPI